MPETINNHEPSNSPTNQTINNDEIFGTLTIISLGRQLACKFGKLKGYTLTALAFPVLLIPTLCYDCWRGISLIKRNITKRNQNVEPMIPRTKNINTTPTTLQSKKTIEESVTRSDKQGLSELPKTEPPHNPTETPKAEPQKDSIDQTVSLSEAKAHISTLFKNLDRSPVVVKEASNLNGCNELYKDILYNCEMKCDRPTKEEVRVFKEQLDSKSTKNDNTVNAYTTAEPRCDRAVGAMTGLVIGDVAGAPLEFRDVIGSQSTKSDKNTAPYYYLDVNGKYHPYGRSIDSDSPSIEDETPETKRDRDQFNRFKVRPGQWTDDSSMALCLTDAYLAHPSDISQYAIPDARARWHTWCHHGYNNAFRFNPRGFHSASTQQSSVGLGGNISQSLNTKTEALNIGDDYTKIPSRFNPKGNKNNSGNGSLMRLAPVVINYSNRSVKEAANAAEASSFASHTGQDAAVACRFMAYMIHMGINNTVPNESAAVFTQRVINTFLNDHKNYEDNKQGMAKLRTLLLQTPATDEDALYKWSDANITLHIRTTIDYRRAIQKKDTKNYPFPIQPDYFGSYALDGLAMSLAAFTQSEDMDSTILNAVNLLGDADTIGAISGQMAGAFYGYNAQKQEGKLTASILKDIRENDPAGAIPLKALMLMMANDSDVNEQVAKENE